MTIHIRIGIIFLFAMVCGCSSKQTDNSSVLDLPRAKRDFEFTYSAKITHLPQDAREVRVWFPVPQSDDNQEVSKVEIKTPYPYMAHTEPVYSNRMAFFELHGDIPQEIPLGLRFKVTRYEDRKEIDLEFPLEKVGQFLQPSRLGAIIPEVEKIASRIGDSQKDPLGQMYEAYRYVLDNMEYKKEGKGWGRGDTSWACSARYGNCTDYHALFIALAQALGIPATFEIGFPLPQDKKEGNIGGYHCWAHFYLGERGWVPVDVSEGDKNPSKREYFFGAHDAHRVKFTTGRDVWLVPRQRGEPLNFFIYPYVEVDGIPHEE
ncbi:MAG: transglutaminase-like domain-containing protein, partial [Candidatus Brocadiales bacterium]